MSQPTTTRRRPNPKFQVGDIVYQSYSPRTVGRVLEVNPKTEEFVSLSRNVYLVRWMNGREVVKSEWDINHLEQLINDTQRKLDLHESNFEKAKLI